MLATTKRRGILFVLAGLLGVALTTTCGLAVRGQQPAAERTTGQTRESKAELQASTHDRRVDQAREEVEFLKSNLDAQNALLRIDESRLQQAKSWKTHFEELFRKKEVTEDRLLAARDDILMFEAHLVGDRANVKLAELRLRQAQHRLDNGEFSTGHDDSRTSDLEKRLASMELKVEQLSAEVGRLRRESAGASKLVPH